MIIKVGNEVGIGLTNDSYNVLWFTGNGGVAIEYPDPDDNGESTTWVMVDEDIDTYKELIRQCENRIKLLEVKQ